jgi:iron complex transport system substrate-binding protein
MCTATVAAWPAQSRCATFEDALGRSVKLEKDPQRIIPLAPNLTEIVYYLGLGDRVVGVTDFSSYPAAAKEKPRVGPYINLNVEKIISLSPELAIGTRDGNSRADVAFLEQAGIQVFIVDPRSVEGVIDSVVRIGEVCGVAETAAVRAAGLNRRLASVRQAIQHLEKPLVFLQINSAPIMTVNGTTVHDNLIRLAGGINMAADARTMYPRISVEEVVKKAPDVIIISSMQRGARFEEVRKQWMQWTSIPAVKNNRVYLIDSDLIDRPSPRIVDGLEALARMIHPGADWAKERGQQ